MGFLIPQSFVPCLVVRALAYEYDPPPLASFSHAIKNVEKRRSRKLKLASFQLPVSNTRCWLIPGEKSQDLVLRQEMEITIVTRPVMPVGVAFKKVGIDLMVRQELIFQLNSLIQVWWFFMPDSHILNQIHIDLSTVDFRNRVSTVARSRCTWFCSIYSLISGAGAREVCGTSIVAYMEGSHPTVYEGVVSRNFCFEWDTGPCQFTVRSEVKTCADPEKPGETFYVYKLKYPPGIHCYWAYCAL